MDKKTLSGIIDALYDEPLTESTKEFLVNREEELEMFNAIALLSPGGIFGLSGIPGVGKTTVLNLVRIDEVDKFFLEISERENKLMIVADILYKFSKTCLKKHLEVEKARKALGFAEEEVSRVLGYSGGINAGVKFDLKREKISSTRLGVYKLAELLEELVEEILKSKEKILVVIDELDKEKRNEVLSVLDTIKGIFNRRGILTIVSLPPSVYRDYLKGSARLNVFAEEGGNLDNAFKDVVMLHPLESDHIVEMLVRRLKRYLGVFELDVFEEVALYSDGIPRDALRILAKAVVYYKAQSKITRDMIVDFIKRETTERFSDLLNLSENYMKVLRVASEAKEISRRDLVERLKEKGLKSQTSYVYIGRLLEKGYLVRTRRGNLRVSGKVRYIFI